MAGGKTSWLVGWCWRTRNMRLIRDGSSHGARVCSRSGVPVSLRFRRVSVLTWVKTPSPLFGCVPYSKPMMVIEEARVKVGLSTDASSHASLLLTVNFRLDSKRIPRHMSLVIACLAGGTSADARTGLSLPLITLRLTHTQPGHTTVVIGCATPEKQIRTPLQSLRGVSGFIR